MFLGTFTPRMDDKGRLIFPAKYRDQLAAGLVVTKGQEHCICVYPIREFERIHEDLRKAPVTSGNARDYVRILLSAAEDLIPDKQGRITIPAELRNYAKLEKECTVIGAGHRLEIWSPTAWEAYLREKEDKFAETATEVVPGLF